MDNSILDKWKKAHLFRVESDRLKKKKYIYSSYPIVNSYGFQRGKFRRYIFADTFARYERMSGYNVLYGAGYNNLANSSFIESKKQVNTLDETLINQFRDELLTLGVGFDEDKEVVMNSEAFVKFEQQVFLHLYYEGLIRQAPKEVYYCKENNKIFQDFQVSFDDGFYYAGDSSCELSKKVIDVFCLSIEQYTNAIAESIKLLNINDSMKSRLLGVLKPKKSLNINVRTTNNTSLDILLDNPELMYGISFIVLNPDLIDVIPHTNDEEIISIEQYLLYKKDVIAGVFSGSFAINPINNYNVPIFISTRYKESVHVGLPCNSNNDIEFANLFGIELLEVKENGIIKNSEFLNGMSEIDAREKIMELFSQEGLGNIKISYSLKEIIISSLDNFGCIIPLLKDPNEEQFYPLDNNIPIMFSSKFRPIIKDEESIKENGNLVSGSLNRLFSTGLASLGMVLFDSNFGITNVSNDEYYDELIKWSPIDKLFITENELIEEIFMPIVLQVILIYKKKFLYANKVYIEGETLDKYGRRFEKQMNNLLSLKDYFEAFNIDAIRMYIMSKKIEEPINLDSSQIFTYHQWIFSFRRYFNSQKMCDHNYSIDFSLHQLIKNINICLNNDDLIKYIDLLKNYFDTQIKDSIISEKQTIIILKLFSIVIPFVCEEIYGNILPSRHCLLDEDWPLS